MWSWVPSMGEKNINSRFHLFDIISWSTSGSPPSLVGKEPACNAGDLGSLPGTGRSPGEGNSNPLQYSCLENPMDRGAWRTIVPGVTSQTRGWQRPFVLCLHPPGCLRRGVRASGPSQERTGESGAFGLWPHPRGSSRISS